MENNSQQIKNKAINGFFWKLSERVLAQLVSFIVSVVLARILMPEEYGVVAIVLIFITLANALVSDGLGASLIQKNDVEKIDFNSVFYAGLLLSLGLYGLLCLASPVIAAVKKNGLIAPILIVLGIRIPLAFVNSVQQAYIARRMEFKKFFFSTLFGTVISGVIGITMAYGGWGAWALVAQYLSNSIIDTLVLFVTSGYVPGLSFSLTRLKPLWAYGSMIMTTNFIGSFFDQLKGLIIAVKYTSTDLAFFNRGERIPLLITGNLSAAIAAVLFPMLSRYQDEKAMLRKVASRFLKIAMYVLFPVMIGLAIVGDRLVCLLLTEKWAQCIPYLRLVCLGELVTIWGLCNVQVIKAANGASILLKYELIKKPLYLAFLFVAMMFGPLAIALGNVLYCVVALFINAHPTAEMAEYPLYEQMRDVLPTIMLTGCMGLIVYSIGKLKLGDLTVLILQIVSGAVFYVGVSVLMKNESFGYLLDIVKEKLESR